MKRIVGGCGYACRSRGACGWCEHVWVDMGKDSVGKKLADDMFILHR